MRVLASGPAVLPSGPAMLALSPILEAARRSELAAANGLNALSRSVGSSLASATLVIPSTRGEHAA